ncbi:MAG TPA: ester cyclase [Edaphobacter sp.]|nr:ester cyclase [Edaphobacter sp.]HMF64968.1 ester cyclase [Edaphobacter sp.]
MKLRSAVFLLLALTPALHAQPTGAPMSDNAATVRRLYEECLNQNRLDLLPQLVSANVINHTYTGDKTGIAAFEQGVQAVQAMFSHQHFTVNGVVADGDKAAAHWTMTAVNSGPIAGLPPSGKPVTQHGIVFYRFEGGKIAEVWLQVDRWGVFQQVGAPVPGGPQPTPAAR